MSKNTMDPDKLQLAIWRRFAFWISKATRAQAHASARVHTHTYSRARTHTRSLMRARSHKYVISYLLLLDSNNGFVKAPLCYVILTLPVLYWFFVFRAFLIMISDYFSSQLQNIFLCNVKDECFLWGRNFVKNAYLKWRGMLDNVGYFRAQYYTTNYRQSHKSIRLKRIEMLQYFFLRFLKNINQEPSIKFVILTECYSRKNIQWKCTVFNDAESPSHSRQNLPNAPHRDPCTRFISLVVLEGKRISYVSIFEAPCISPFPPLTASTP
jgi:hypothetical protein